MSRTHTGTALRTERESKLRPSPEFELSALSDLDGMTSEALPPLDLEATYHDTSALTLARSGITVRYRTGEPPDRWTVKLPSGSTDKTLVRRELDLVEPATGEIEQLLAVHLRGRVLEPVAVITTARNRVLLSDEDGEPLVEVAFDLVTVDATAAGPGSWEEIEVEALHPTLGAEALRRTVRALRDLGCRRAPSTPKLVRALGTAASAPPEVGVPTLPKHPKAGDALGHALARSVHQILDHDPRVRLGDDPEDLHHFRVAVRRLRSDLRLVRGSVDDAVIARLDEDLSWVADATNRSRDLDVLHWWLQVTGTSLPQDSASGLLALVARCEQQQIDAHRPVLEVLGSARYRALVDDLVRLVNDRPAPGKSDEAALRRRLHHQLRRRWRKLDKRMARVEVEATDTALHRARISAKRCRAVAEAYAPLGGARTARLGRALAELQDALGAAHDAAVIEAWLREAATDDAAFVAGELAATARADGARHQARWPEVWASARRRARHL